jgi:hypothetical protein
MMLVIQLGVYVNMKMLCLCVFNLYKYNIQQKYNVITSPHTKYTMSKQEKEVRE